jgi:hypothetical protein
VCADYYNKLLLEDRDSTGHLVFTFILAGCHEGEAISTREHHLCREGRSSLSARELLSERDFAGAIDPNPGRPEGLERKLEVHGRSMQQDLVEKGRSAPCCPGCRR